MEIRISQGIESAPEAVMIRETVFMEEQGFDGTHTVQELLNRLYDKLEKEGFAAFFGKGNKGREIPGNLAMPRREELFACLNRYRRML